jgi:hypothetical protein
MSAGIAQPLFGRGKPISQTVMTTRDAASAVLRLYTAQDHRQRLENIAACKRTIRKCLRKHLITAYVPGQCSYNLGEYPCREPWDPDGWDARELDKLRDQGIRLIQVHEEWNDSQRLFGGDKLTPLNPAGFRRFLDMVHQRGMKLIVYVSTGFFEHRDPDFRKEWARDQDLVELHYDYARCSPASPSWRAYLLPRLMRILDEYGVDGYYNDMGYLKLAGNPKAPTPDEVLAFEENDHHDGALTDLLSIIYAEVKRRGGIVKLHLGAADRPQTDLKVYDYLWVGEQVEQVDDLRQAVKGHPPYVVPCVDLSRTKIESEDELYLNSIPYMQFPLLLAGRPFTGERAAIPSIHYQPEEEDFLTAHARAIWKHYQAHPEGPYSYGWWDSVPGRPDARSTHGRWLEQHLPLVEEGSWAWLEITDSGLFQGALPQSVVATAFANCRLYLVLANYGRTTLDVETSDSYIPICESSAAPKKKWRLVGRSLLLLQRAS